MGTKPYSGSNITKLVECCASYTKVMGSSPTECLKLYKLSNHLFATLGLTQEERNKGCHSDYGRKILSGG